MYMEDLLYLTEKELIDEAKRVVPIVYDEDELLSCKSSEVMRDYINPLYEDFYTELELKIIYYCCMKNEGEDYLKVDVDLEPIIEHFNKYIKLYNTLHKIATNL